ncbi:hypothetical protein BC828DRAFT_381648 [Blastocladiella britannica]|nr:hypothetical protein BC828DRAFT_381648 [Blastocladiella britannica]
MFKSTILLIATVAAIASAQSFSFPLPSFALPTSGAVTCPQAVPNCPATCSQPMQCAIKGQSATECARAECRQPSDISNGWSLAPNQVSDGTSLRSTATATDTSTTTVTSTSTTAVTSTSSTTVTSTSTKTVTSTSVTPVASQTPSGADANKGGALVAAVVVGAAAFAAL